MYGIKNKPYEVEATRLVATLEGEEVDSDSGEDKDVLMLKTHGGPFKQA